MTNHCRIGIEELINNPMNRVPVVFCLDVSGSMIGPPLDELNDGIRRFVSNVKEDPIAGPSVELCVVTFADNARLVTDFREVGNIQYDHLISAGGCTNLGAGVEMALDRLEERKNLYKNVGIEYFQPLMVLMTDGDPNIEMEKVAEVADRTTLLEANLQLLVVPVGIGFHANMNELARFSKKLSPLNLPYLELREFFDWLSKYVAKVSQLMSDETVQRDIDGNNSWGEI